MANEVITECEKYGLAVLNFGVHDNSNWGDPEPTAPASCPTTTSTPPSWWQQMAGAHDLEQAQKRGQLNLL